MPSIPQSLLWISLVVLWLFVLVPMLISKRDTVRRTSDVALATRVLNTGARRPAAAPARTGRRPPQRPGLAADATTTLDDDDDDGDDDRRPRRARRSCVAAADGGDRIRVPRRRRRRGGLRRTAGRRVRRSGPSTERDRELPLDFDDNTADVLGRRPSRGRRSRRGRRSPEPTLDGPSSRRRRPSDMTDEFEATSDDGTDHDYEYVDDSSGLEAAVGHRPARRRLDVAGAPPALRVEDRRGGERAQVQVPQADADGDGGRCCWLSAVAAYLVSPTLWWVCGTVGAVTAAVPGLSAPSDPHRGAACAAGARSGWRGRGSAWRTPRTRSSTSCRRGCGARCGGAGDRRRGSDLRAPRVRAVRPRVRPAAGGGPVARAFSPVDRATGSLLPVQGAIAQLVARLVRIEKVRGSIPLSSTSLSRSGQSDLVARSRCLHELRYHRGYRIRGTVPSLTRRQSVSRLARRWTSRIADLRTRTVRGDAGHSRSRCCAGTGAGRLVDATRAVARLVEVSTAAPS